MIATIDDYTIYLKIRYLKCADSKNAEKTDVHEEHVLHNGVEELGQVRGGDWIENDNHKGDGRRT